MNFESLNLNERILEAVKNEGYSIPSPIQQKAIPPALEGRDILGCAQTGTGKTAAFALPILHRLSAQCCENTDLNVSAPPKQLRPSNDGAIKKSDTHKTFSKRKIRALILTPTRELALQIQESFNTYGKKLDFKCVVIMGGVSQSLQINILNSGVDILVATPGRLLDLYKQKAVDLKNVEYFVLDEADRMLDMGFIHDVKKIIEIIPKKRQTLFFTATLPPEIIKLTKTLLINPVEVTVTPISSTVDKTKQSVYLTDKLNKTNLLIWLIQNKYITGSALIFTRTKHGADRLVKCLKRAEIDTMAIHGDKSQGARQNALESFKSGKIQALVATDIAARGIDIEDLNFVVNYELPNEPETYVHRIGRTGRAGKTGTAISFCDFDEKEYLKDIEKLIKKNVEVVGEHPFPMTIFVKSPPKVQQQRKPRR